MLPAPALMMWPIGWTPGSCSRAADPPRLLRKIAASKMFVESSGGDNPADNVADNRGDHKRAGEDGSGKVRTVAGISGSGCGGSLKALRNSRNPLVVARLH